MIVYREPNSLQTDLEFSLKTLYSLSNNTEPHYKQYRLGTGRNGRIISEPDNLLKAVQRKIYNTILVHEPISSCALAYRYGGNVVKNAMPHINKNIVLKLDIRHFFDSIKFDVVKEKVFAPHRYSEATACLLTQLCTYNGCLPQGAPTSPSISNIVMKDFDDAVFRYCRDRRITYTRYCDDMTFSGDFNTADVIEFVKAELVKYGLCLNNKKTRIAGRGSRQSVTGVTVNKKLSAPIEYRKKIRQEMYYCKKFGVDDHIKNKYGDVEADKFIISLLGRVNYVLTINPKDKEMLGYKEQILFWKHNG